MAVNPMRLSRYPDRASPAARGIETTSLELRADLAAKPPDEIGKRQLREEARRLAVAAAAESAGDHRHVHAVVGRAQADLARVLVTLGQARADEAAHRGPLDRAEEVDDPLGVGLRRARLLEVLARQVGDRKSVV